MNLGDLADLAARQLPQQGASGMEFVQPLPGLGILRHPRPTSFEAAIMDPVVCLVLRGRKETMLGADLYPMAVGQFLLLSHDLPVIARVTKAPYLALLFDLSLETLRSLYEEMGPSSTPGSPGAPTSPARATAEARSISVQSCHPTLVDALARYVALAGAPTDAAVLGPLIAREVHYRLATAPFGGMLRSLIRHDSHASAIARAIARLRADFRAPIEVPELARSVGMSPSAFHKHFKAITASSPLQFQKHLRLLEARRRLRAGGTSVSTAAFDVGYESATQFSREYARKFGAPPKQDLPPVEAR